MTLKGILFDFNGTLLFDSDMHMEAFRRAFPKYGKPVPSDEFMIQKCFGRTNETIYRENFDANGTPEDIQKFEEIKENLYHELCLESPSVFRLVDGAEEMLDELKARGIPFCLATGSNWFNVEFYIRHLGLDRWFSKENMIYDDGTYPGKPAPDIYQLAAKKLGLAPSECLVFEDGTSGIRAANAAGAGAVVVVYEEKYQSPLTEQTRVDQVFHDHLAWRQTLADYGILR
ncbi:MAG: HAD family phosphatase [Clostridia bacterium]|nr:HAD family phosphatase [Clostridia bacterium]